MNYLNLIKLFSFLITLGLLSSCKKDELPLTSPINSITNPNNSNDPSNPTDLNNPQEPTPNILFVNSVDMGEDYGDQIWFSLSTNKVIKTNLRTDWDFSFDNRDGKHILYLNSATIPSAAISTSNDIITLTNDVGLDYKNEHHSGASDKIAIGDISNLNSVIVIDRGYTPDGSKIGKWKIQITSIGGDSYTFSYAELNSTTIKTGVVKTNSSYNRTAFSFSTDTEIQIEPAKDAYDLCFTQYTNIFSDPPLAYSVNGVIINSNNTSVAEEFTTPFESITKTRAEGLTYAANVDVIGYDWKQFDLQNNTYNIQTNQNYVVKTSNGDYFKIRFISFYNENGIKGAPGFEFMKL
ncbi:MAG: HmuY family protein [Salibacteraceae bacterium]|nr:HmuY family protein [Salibacteraceae bacterium]|tara:strand:- start:27341 stop:28393 length:1053 start_codon:yes stop_codon:yes gene_type:complete